MTGVRARPDKPVVSVVVVSDYGGGEATAWEDLRRTLAALSRQDFDEPSEFLLVERSDLAPRMPPDVAPLLPSLRVIPTSAASSYELKNVGVHAAAGEIVAILDADCVPDRDWLRQLVAAMKRQPDAVAISGRTMYAGRTATERLLALLTRSYLDPGRIGSTRFISNNNAGFRRSAFLLNLLPTDAGPFASRVQSEAILRAGGALFFEPRMRVVHEFEGWPMERDIRMNIGYATIATRLRDRAMPYAWLTRLGYASIPLFAIAKTLDSYWDCLRCRRHYEVRRHELAIAFLLGAVVHAMEVPGMIRAFRGQAIEQTAYR